MITVGTTHGSGAPNVDAYRVAFAVAAGCALVALGFAQTIRDGEARSAVNAPRSVETSSVPDTRAPA
jgi:hypothetical protein